MAYYLTSAGTSGEYVSFTPVARSSTDWRIEFKVINPTDSSVFYVAGDPGFQNRLFTQGEPAKDKLEYRIGATSYTFLWPEKLAYDGNPHNYEIIQSGGSLTAKRDGELSTDTFAVNVYFDGFEYFFRSASTSYEGSLYYFRYYESGTIVYDWDANLSNGTGSVLPEAVTGRDGALIDFPTDDSQWVFYDDGGGGTDLLTANDISSLSSVSSPSIAQTHALTANDVSSPSSVTAPALGQNHSLTSADVQSASEVSSPALATQSNTDNLSANDISSTSSVSSPTLGQVHNLAANDATSTSETGTPTLRQTHALTSVDIQSLSTVSSPALTSVAGQDALAANDVQATSTVSSPTIGQVHNLTPDNLSSQSETDGPTLGQVHALTANDLNSATQVSSPTLRDASQVLVTPIRNTKATVSQTTYKAAIIQPVYKAEAG